MKTFNGNLTSGMALAFYIVWGIKHKVWSSFFGALTGELVISGSRVSGSGSTKGAPPSSTPTVAPTHFK